MVRDFSHSLFRRIFSQTHSFRSRLYIFNTNFYSIHPLRILKFRDNVKVKFKHMGTCAVVLPKHSRPATHYITRQLVDMSRRTTVQYAAVHYQHYWTISSTVQLADIPLLSYYTLSPHDPHYISYRLSCSS